MARKKKPLFGVSTYIKKKPRKRPGRHAKRPNKYKRKKPCVVKVKNVWSNVQDFNISLFSWK